MKLDHVVILARSLDKSLPWHSALLPALGFEKTRDHVWYDGELAFDVQEAKPETREYERYGPGVNHLGFTAPDEEAADRVREAMAAAGFDVPDKQRLGPLNATFFKDPDGLRVEVTVYD